MLDSDRCVDVLVRTLCHEHERGSRAGARSTRIFGISYRVWAEPLDACPVAATPERATTSSRGFAEAFRCEEADNRCRFARVERAAHESSQNEHTWSDDLRHCGA
jgi:hypothetical protein